MTQQSHRPGRSVYSVTATPIPPRVRKPGDEEVYRTICTAKYSNQGIDIRVDWDGEQLHHFQVLTSDAAEPWLSLDQLEVGRRNSLVAPSTQQTYSAFQARFRRGPWHKKRPFWITVIPIEWLHASDDEFSAWMSDSEFTAVRDHHYRCSSDPAEARTHASSEYRSVQWLSISLDAGRDYEVWVKLQHPGNESHYLQDPIVRTGSGDVE